MFTDPLAQIGMLFDHSVYPCLLFSSRNGSSMLRRAPRPTQFHGSRAFHLIHNLFAVDASGNAAKQLATVTRKTFPQADEVSLKLIDDKSGKRTTMTLSQALQRVKPLSYLAEAGPGEYRIRTFPDPSPVPPIKEVKGINKSYKPFMRAGRGKEAHLTTSCGPTFLHHSLRIFYKVLLQGARMEIHLHRKSVKARKPDDHPVDWALAHCLHLRPDSILAAMPWGTTILAHPCTSNLSFKKRMPHNVEETTSQVMWAMENQAALHRQGANTPIYVKQQGKWQREAVNYNNPSSV